MRVIGGKLKGRRLSAPGGLRTRPTPERVREAVFNILPREFPFENVLDLYAGTGAMAIEALSRGAHQAVLIDRDQKAVSAIRKNIRACGLSERARVVKDDVVGAVRRLAGRGGTFDLVFIDPPYEAGLTEKTLEAVSSGALAPGGVVVAEASKKTPAIEPPEGLELVDARRYGDTVVYFYADTRKGGS